MSVHQIARGLLPYCPRGFHLRRVHHRHDLGLGQPIRIVQYIRTQKYSTDGGTSEPDDLANRVTKLEKAFSTTMEDGFKKLNDELTKSLEKSLEKSLTATNDGIKDLRSWVRWIVGTFGVGIMLKIVFYDRYTEEKLATKIKDSETRLTTMIKNTEVGIKDSETRLTTMIQNAITQLKLELKVERQELLLSDQNKKNQ